MKKKDVTCKVIRVTRSPMNRQRWCLDLECGHEAWRTSQREPKTFKAKCNTCTGAQQS